MNLKAVVRVVVAAVAVVTLAATVSTVPAQGATQCSAGPLSQPFLPWGDPAQYALLPNGGFERDGSRWQLAGGAAIAFGNEPFFVRSYQDDSSLRLGPGGSATSRPFCISWADPTLRFFAQRDGDPLSALQVDVLYTDELGTEQVVSYVVPGAGDWQPTAPLPLVANATVPPLLTDGMTEVSVRFTVLGDGAWSIDDVYVDPFKTK